MNLEEKRRALQAEKLRKQQEMAALEAEEEALLAAAQGEDNSGMFQCHSLHYKQRCD